MGGTQRIVSNMPHYVLFTTPQCAPCKMLKEQIGLQRLAPGVSLEIVDAMLDPRVVEFRVRKVPTLVDADTKEVFVAPADIMARVVGGGSA